jgi:hypothetical protein
LGSRGTARSVQQAPIATGAVIASAIGSGGDVRVAGMLEPGTVRFAVWTLVTSCVIGSGGRVRGMEDVTEAGWPRNIPRAPAPWLLRGDAYVVVTTSSTATNLEDAGICAALRPHYRNLFNVLMVVDYKASPVGPYLEILYIPGHFRLGSTARGMSISRIYVSSEASVHNGNANWGLTKSCVEFSRRLGADGADAFRVGGGEGFANLAFRGFGPALPMGSGLLPRAMRSFVQVREGRCYAYSLSVRGRTRAARVDFGAFDAAMFPDMNLRKVRLAVHIADFTLDFHESAITSWPR